MEELKQKITDTLKNDLLSIYKLPETEITKELELLTEAFNWVDKYHSTQKRASGESYSFHPLRVALATCQLHLGTNATIAALLHDTIEDCQVDENAIKQTFGSEVVFMVNGLTKISKLNCQNLSPELAEAENLRNMILAMAKDIRVIIIKLLDRLDNVKTLWALDPAKRLRIASETIDIFAPLAYRLGLTSVGAQLEDYSFPYADPEAYKLTKRILGHRQQELEQYLAKLLPFIENQLKNHNIQIIDIKSRVKHLYSIWRKLQKENMDIDRIYDLVALRIIVPNEESCYGALGVIHQLWKPMPGRFKDYIALPKPNGYRSLHTTVFTEHNRMVEIQIRTQQMDEEAERGVAAWWVYGILKNTPIYKQRKKFIIPKKFHWVNQLAQWQRSFSSGTDFVNSLKTDFFKDRIFALTPKGDIIDLPANATPVDFAYQLHTELGHKTKGAKVNGQIVPLNYHLQSGEIVEILTKKDLKPSSSWLEFVVMADTKKAILKQLKKSGLKNPYQKPKLNIRLEIWITDKPGVLEQIIKIISKLKINILENKGVKYQHKSLLTFDLRLPHPESLTTLTQKLKSIKEIREIKID